MNELDVLRVPGHLGQHPNGEVHPRAHAAEQFQDETEGLALPASRSTTYGAVGRGSVCSKLANRATSIGEHSRRSRWARFDHLSRASESTSEILPDEVTLPTKAVEQGTSVVGNLEFVPARVRHV